MTIVAEISPKPEARAPWSQRHWTSRDGLKLHYRDYAGSADRPAVLCLPGLTRNARDFEALAEHLAPTWRVLCPDLRGRGESAYAKDSASYNPLQYADDIDAMFEQAGLTRVVAIGTSLGGLLIMLIAASRPERLAGAVLNDIGPEVEPGGIERIRGYVGQGRSFPTWMHAARALEESQAGAFPGYGISDWLAMAKRSMAIAENGRIHFDYDMKIAEPLSAPDGPAQPDLWPVFGALADRPLLLLRGEISDVLSAHSFERMRARMPDALTAIIPGVGHAPTLDEPEARAAIDRLLDRVG
jgi:pimeloyl-ACP methyl ester carboxylesterase